MKKTLLFIILMSTTIMFSQNKSFWQKQAPAHRSQIQSSKQNLPKTQTYSLNFEALKQALELAPERGSFAGNSNLIISFPNAEGQLEQFRIMEASVMHPDLAARYPGIKSYAGQGIDDPTARIRFSMSPLGLQSMQLSGNSSASFIEPLTTDLSQYTVYKRADKIADFNNFECTVTNTINRGISSDNIAMRNADDAILRTYRLAMSATGEYTSYHGGTKALALAAINTTMTRVNGIFETDFNVTMVLIANTDAVIYTNSSSDPYTNSLNSQLQSTLTSVIGEANYDVGHLVHNGSNNGNAGCIGCVCVNGSKGSGFTSHSTPEGDFFDVDYVAHEFGHQFGGRHTFTHSSEGAGIAQVEPGSGSTIMSYAGITGATDVQSNVDPYFHAISIQQISDYVKSTSCQTNTNTGNAVPTANAGVNYTIPKGTPFILEGSGSDANAGDVLTYCWEQMDENNASTTYPSVNATTGVAFRTYTPTTNTDRYFPRLSTIKTGATSWQWEAIPNVARTLNFRFTVRDNRAGGGNNNSDDMVINVNGTAGPFVLNSPNTNVTWNAGTTQTVTWNVAGTTGNGVNAANVDIFLSTDGGDTYTIALASGVPNDGSQDIIVPNNQGSQNRIMVRGSNHIFFDISNTNFTIAGTVVCNADVPTGLNASSLGTTTATLSWDAVSGATYDLRYRTTGSSTWTTNAVTGISSNLTGLSTLTQYEAQVRSKCSGGSNSAYSSSVNFTTTDVQLNYCSSASTNINDEFISRVQINTIDNSSGGQFYTDFTNISTTLTKDTQYTITVTPTWTGTIYSEGYSVWIDYNRDGDFADSGEQVWTQAATQNTPVSGSFTIPTSAVENSTTMRVSMKYNGIPTSCETFTYGEVEDYTVIIEGNGPDTIAPVITLIGASTINLNVGDTYTEQGATATDNIDGNITANIVTTGTVNTTVGGTYLVNYNVSDAAGNAATQVTRTVNVTQPSTGCSGGITSYPYSEGFENTLGAWTQSTADDINWTVDANGTPSSGTGPSSAIQGSYYVYVEASGNGTGYPNKQAILNSPCFNLSTLSEATFSFKYHQYGSTNMGTINLEISDDDGTSWSSIWNSSGNLGNSWQTANVSLTSFVGGSVQLRFNRITGSTWQADVAIDDVSLTSGGGSGGNCNVGDINLSITLDNYPQETAWTLKDALGTTIASTSYSTANPDGSTVTRTFTGLADGQYTFTITDSYGDGICCSYGNGSYTLTGSTGTIVSGGSFNSSESTNFCIQSNTAKGDNADTISNIFEVKLYPNPVKGSVLNISTNYTNVTYEIFNSIGQMVAKGKVANKRIDVSGLEMAIYHIRFTTEEEIIMKRFIKQ